MLFMLNCINAPLVISKPQNEKLKEVTCLNPEMTDLKSKTMQSLF